MMLGERIDDHAECVLSVCVLDELFWVKYGFLASPVALHSLRHVCVRSR